MGFFRHDNTPKMPIDWRKVMYIVMGAFVILYVIGYYFGLIETTPGVLALMAMVFLAVGVSFAVVKKQVKNQEMSKRDLLAVVSISILCITMMILLRTYLPEAFEQSLSMIQIQAQSIIGMP